MHINVQRNQRYPPLLSSESPCLHWTLCWKLENALELSWSWCCNLKVCLFCFVCLFVLFCFVLFLFLFFFSWFILLPDLDFEILMVLGLFFWMLITCFGMSFAVFWYLDAFWLDSKVVEFNPKQIWYVYYKNHVFSFQLILFGFQIMIIL